MKTKLMPIVWLLVFGWAVVLPADIVIDLDEYVLQPDTPNQTISIFVSTDTNSLVRGVVFNAEIGDGGSAFGGVAGPTIQGVDLINGTIFQNNTQFVDDLGSLPQLAIWSLVTTNANPDSLAQGLLARLTIDTTGFHGGETFRFEMGSTLNGSTEFPVQGGSVFPSITEGSIRIAAIPEPGFPVLVFAAMLGIWAARSGKKTTVQPR